MQHRVYYNENEWMSLKLTGAWPTLSLWLEHAPWGITLYDKWVVLQINCSYCPCSATLTKGEQCCARCRSATLTHSDKLTLRWRGAHRNNEFISSVHDAWPMQPLLISWQPLKGVWSLVDPWSFPPVKHYVQINYGCSHKALKKISWEAKMINWSSIT